MIILYMIYLCYNYMLLVDNDECIIYYIVRDIYDIYVIYIYLFCFI